MASLIRSSYRKPQVLCRWYSTSLKATVKDHTVPELTPETQQAPNRNLPWSPSQQPRSEIVKDLRFTQRDLSQQPMAYSAMELIHKQPIRYLEHTNVAVCSGNKGKLQGHPKVFINLDGPHSSTCGYCGLQFAKAEFKDIIEGKK